MPFVLPQDGGGDNNPPGFSGIAENLHVIADANLLGDVVSFDITNISNVSQVLLWRSGNDQFGSATMIHTCLRQTAAQSFHDTDSVLTGKNWWYWVQLTGVDGTSAEFGPVHVSLKNPNTIPAAPINWFDASHDALNGISVKVNVKYKIVQGVDFLAMRIYINGYQGNVTDQLIGEGQGNGFSFHVKQTGEIVTLKAVIVNSGGVQQAIGTASVKVLTLRNAATVPARLSGIDASEGSGITQISCDGGLEFALTKFRLYRSARGDTFAHAVLVMEIPPTGDERYTLSDVNKGSGFQWFVTAVNSIGESIASDAVWPLITF